MIALALLAGLVVWLFARSSGGSPAKPASRAPAVAISPSELRTLAGGEAAPIYWIGPLAGYTYELTKTADRRFFIRYLPAGAPVGSTQSYLIIGTYPVANAFAVTAKTASKSDAVKLPVPGAVAFYAGKVPTNVYLAYPGSSEQIEVYDPSAARAQSLVTSGQITPVVTRRAAAKATSPTALKALETKLGHPLYWAGPKKGVTYELTQASGGSVYLRYLAPGARVGSNKPYLTIGSYSLTNAFATTKSLASEAGAVRIEVGGGGVAFYTAARPTNVYLAYPGEGVQIEVYDPSAARAHELVASRMITPVP